MKKLIWYIHGANSTPRSFTWLKSQLPSHDIYDVSYQLTDPMQRTINHLLRMSEDRPISIIGHSLGGIIAVALAKSRHIERIVTMGTPFAGSRLADRLRWWLPCELFENVRTTNPIILALNDDLNIPVLSFVTTGGHLPLMGEPNDGMVSVNSQLHLRGPQYIKVPQSHFEVLLSPEIIEPIRSFLFQNVRSIDDHDDRAAGIREEFVDA